MKKLIIRSPIILFSLVFSFGSNLFSAEQVALEELRAQKHEKMPLFIGLMNVNNDLKKMSELLKKDLEFTGQFAVTVEKVTEELTTKDQVKQWFKKGYPLIVYLQPASNGYEWRVYDTADARMIKGKKYQKVGTNARGWAHAIADEVWAELTGSQGFFSTKIVYGKDTYRRGRNCKKYIYMRDATDVEGISEEILAASPTISVAPRWNRDTENPTVIYSEYTKTNVRLIAVNMHGKRRVVSDFEGVNMQVSYSLDGKEVVYCLSRAPYSNMKNHTTSQLYHYRFDAEAGRPLFTRLTTNNGNNFAPCWGPNNTLFYSSDASKNGMPNICWYNLKTKQLAWVTQDSYATSPNYNPVSNKLIYTKMLNKKMQLFEYDLAKNEHHQLTFDDTNKDDCSWSPCGNLVAYSVEEKGKSRLAIFNLNTREQQFLTSEKDDSSYPSWSPRYANVPRVA